MQRFWCLLWVALITASPTVFSQSQSEDIDQCAEVTGMSGSVFDMVRGLNKDRIKKNIRAAAKLYKIDCLRQIISRFGGLGRLFQFLGGSIWSRIGNLNLGQMLCNAVLDNLPDDFNGAAGDWVPSLDVLAVPPGTMAADRRRSAMRSA